MTRPASRLLLQLAGGQVQLATGDDELLDLLGALEDVEDLSGGAGQRLSAGQSMCDWCERCADCDVCGLCCGISAG